MSALKRLHQMCKHKEEFSYALANFTTQMHDERSKSVAQFSQLYSKIEKKSKKPHIRLFFGAPAHCVYI